MAVVTVVNYGLGNIQAFFNIYNRLNIAVEIATTPEQLARANRIILPGVGAFDWAMERLNKSGLRETLDKLVLQIGVPVLGVCVGMQMMGRRSEEGKVSGLGWIDADVVRFNTLELGALPLPHMGWNDISSCSSACLLRNIQEPLFYFLHSYYMVPHSSADILATAEYGSVFTAAIRHGHILGTQFHPEKSHKCGVELLRNFAETPLC